MPRAKGRDLCEIFGYAPDDTSPAARVQWKNRECPFVGEICIKIGHSTTGEAPQVYGTCSVAGAGGKGARDEIIICPQRLYADDCAILKTCAKDAFGEDVEVVSSRNSAEIARLSASGKPFAVMLGRHAGGEIRLRGKVSLSLDWVIVLVTAGAIQAAIPCEVQSVDITGNYREAWKAYAEEHESIPDSKHGVNWANVWKRLIPQILLKGAVASASSLCHHGSYFVLPELVFRHFEKLVGEIPAPPNTHRSGVLNVWTYKLGAVGPPGAIRPLVHCRSVRMALTDFAAAFASGREFVPLGLSLDEMIRSRVGALLQ